MGRESTHHMWSVADGATDAEGERPMSATLLDFMRDVIASLQSSLWPDAPQFTIPVYYDYFATFTWAVSGALIGVHRRYDLVGVFVIALVSAVGGGLLRDGIV